MRSLAEAVRAAVESARKDRPGRPSPRPRGPRHGVRVGARSPSLADAAEWQAARIAKTRGVPEQRIREVIRRHVEPRTLGFLGEPRVNVLVTNLDLDRVLSGTIGIEWRSRTVEALRTTS